MLHALARAAALLPLLPQVQTGAVGRKIVLLTVTMATEFRGALRVLHALSQSWSTKRDEIIRKGDEITIIWSGDEIMSGDEIIIWTGDEIIMRSDEIIIRKGDEIMRKGDEIIIIWSGDEIIMRGDEIMRVTK